ncbi:hypothetical protein SASPL_136399 [Salvia splendens]|uniref:Uncharacterized protein n=1 Tax=Salvia splendens TaxID=180675 RepID=A0A8X8ZHH5_SALSN|nr:hypothetical protein SASPL_136399 [Salvia splendens]
METKNSMTWDYLIYTLDLLQDKTERAKVYPFSNPVGRFCACEKGVVVEEDLGLKGVNGIAEDGSGATRATAIATEIRLVDQLIGGLVEYLSILLMQSTLNLQENLGVGFELGNAGEM